jgi:hypothetical protein
VSYHPIRSYAILADIIDERKRQYATFGDQGDLTDYPVDLLEVWGYSERLDSLPSADVARRWCDDADREGHLSWSHILTEEFAEVVDEADVSALGRGSSALRTELVQLAAVCVAWIEAIDSRTVKS